MLRLWELTPQKISDRNMGEPHGLPELLIRLNPPLIHQPAQLCGEM